MRLENLSSFHEQLVEYKILWNFSQGFGILITLNLFYKQRLIFLYGLLSKISEGRCLFFIKNFRQLLLSSTIVQGYFEGFPRALYVFYVPIQGKFTLILVVFIIATDFQCLYIHKRKENNSSKRYIQFTLLSPRIDVLLIFSKFQLVVAQNFQNLNWLKKSLLINRCL